jgi:hypothetical protein
MGILIGLALLSILAIAQGADYGLAGSGGVDILGEGIFETSGSAVKFPAFQDTNIDSLEVGNDKSVAMGTPWQKNPLTTATNNLVIKKNQDSGECRPCNASPCQDYCLKVNIEQIDVGNRLAMSLGSASSTNNVKIVTNQE